MVYSRILFNNIKEYTPTWMKTIPHRAAVRPNFGKKTAKNHQEKPEKNILVFFLKEEFALPINFALIFLKPEDQWSKVDSSPALNPKLSSDSSKNTFKKTPCTSKCSSSCVSDARFEPF